MNGSQIAACSKTDELGRMTEAVNLLRRSVPAFTAWPGMWPLVETPATSRSMTALCEMKLNLQLAKYQQLDV